MIETKYPHVFQPLTIRGVTLKNRLQYAPTVVLKCEPNGDMSRETCWNLWSGRPKPA